MQSRCERKRLFSVLSQMYQSCIYIYIRCETKRLVQIKTDTIFLTSVHEIALVDV